MANLKISELPDVGSLAENAYFPLAQGGTTYKVPLSGLTDSISGTSSNNYVTTGITTSQTLSWDKQYWGISGTTNVDVTLPSLAGKNGYFLIVKDEAGICGTYRIRITPTDGTIDGEPYVDMNINNMSLTIMTRNNNWYII
jgi:hypothetical protein